MNCSVVQEKVDDYFDGLLKPLEHQAIEQHIEHCNACAGKFNERGQLLSILKSIPAARAPQELRRRIINARAAKQSKRLVWFSAGFASAMAASVVIALLVLLKPFAGVRVEIPTVTAVSNHVSEIQFVVHAEKPFENVRFSVQVPQSLQIKGYAGLQELAWNGKLLQGDNLLSLPVIALQKVPGVVVMRVQYQNASKEYRVNVNVRDGKHLS
jgi:anti-sigma-K factor RskA